ncbi:DeoR/GlpR family DNA-binding transcription regulator [Ascidiaceihabitans sp.]|uniref:DeoR/GlpR family DNA-binding transcription regulator n=1 Tax=Ascidiaceihabitans sp. TaxID=1872644 RepID=UPI003296CCA8
MKAGQNPKSIRRRALLDLIVERGYLSLVEASRELGVSEQTVRRDVKAFEKLGKVRRTHGGVAFAGSLSSGTYLKRQLSQTAEKASIARQIASMIPDGASVFLDSGTTCEAISEALLERRNLKIVTYSIRCASHFLGRSDFSVAIPGGFVRHIDGTIIGPHHDDFIEQFRFDYAAIAVSGMDQHGRLSDDDVFEVNRVRAAIGMARETILALTSDKIGLSALINLADLSEVDFVVASGERIPGLERLVKDKNVHLVYSE